ncbi:MAG: hypothetical protein JSW14_00580 [Candidatus Bathyarchaeum sp.]|nr:MAG: hypothetical protein JSW14_00580 [Candidatus Bathyarchaeum sp.]
MNKFALILPLLMLAVFLGYCGSVLPREWVYAAIIVTVVVVAIVGYFLFLEKQKTGEGKRKRKP